MSEMVSSVEHLVRRHPSGTVLFREGDRGQTMYVIRSGRVNISKRIGDSEITLAVLGPGEFFGEMALLEGLPRSAGATVVEDALLIEVEQAAFETLVRKNGEIAVRLMRRLSSRLREADRQIQSLMSRSGAARALSLVRTVAESPDKNGRRLLPEELRGVRAGRQPGPAGGPLHQVPEVQEPLHGAQAQAGGGGGGETGQAGRRGPAAGAGRGQAEGARCGEASGSKGTAAGCFA